MFIIHPEKKFKIIWDSLILILTLYVAIEVPLHLVFDYELTPTLLGLEVFVTVVFAIDIIINFRTAYKRKTTLVTDSGKMAKRYLKTWFTIDFLSTIPIDLIVSVFGVTDLRVLRILKVGRLFRLLRFFKLIHYFTRLENQAAMNPIIFRFVVFGFLITLASHWIACGWLAIGGPIGIGPDGDLAFPFLGAGGPLVIDLLSNGERYLRAAYWTLTTLTTVGYGDLSPETNTQAVYTMFVMIIGVGVYGYIIGNVSTLIGQLDLAKVEFQEKLKRVNAFMRYKKIPRDIQERVALYYEHIWENKMGSDEGDILRELPDSIRTDISEFLNKDILSKVPLFKGASRAFLTDIAINLQPRVFTPGDYIVRKGNVGTKMFFISNGIVEVVSEDGQQVFATLHPGSFFGEIALLLSSPRTASIRATEYCDIYSLDKEAFNHVLENYPDFAEHIRKETERRVRELQPQGAQTTNVDNDIVVSDKRGSTNDENDD